MSKDNWQPIETLKQTGTFVLLYSEDWIDEDFNPEGIREGFRDENDDGPIISSKWDGCHDYWKTEICFNATHWMPRPKPPGRG